MFSDIVFNCLESILDDLTQDTAYPSIYDRHSVILMIAHMKYITMLSDQQEPGVTMSLLTKVKLMNVAKEQATEDYNERMVIHK